MHVTGTPSQGLITNSNLSEIETLYFCNNTTLLDVD
jgi:hypothetical protein